MNRSWRTTHGTDPLSLCTFTGPSSRQCVTAYPDLIPLGCICSVGVPDGLSGNGGDSHWSIASGPTRANGETVTLQ